MCNLWPSPLMLRGSNPAHDEVYSIKFVSDLRQVGGFLHQQNWPPWYNWNIVERDIQHHKTKPSIYRWPNTENLNKMSSKWPPCSHIDFSRKYIVCIKHYFTTNYKLMISNHLQVTGGSYQNINMVAVQPSWIAHASALYSWPISLQNISSRFQPTYSNGK